MVWPWRKKSSSSAAWLMCGKFVYAYKQGVTWTQNRCWNTSAGCIVRKTAIVSSILQLWRLPDSEIPCKQRKSSVVRSVSCMCWLLKGILSEEIWWKMRSIIWRTSGIRYSLTWMMAAITSTILLWKFHPPLGWWAEELVVLWLQSDGKCIGCLLYFDIHLLGQRYFRFGFFEVIFPKGSQRLQGLWEFATDDYRN